MSSEPDFQFQSLAASLPQEVIDQILAIRFAMNLSTETKDGKALALVCRRWWRAAQRYLFEGIKLDKVAQVQELADTNVTFGQHVKMLAIHVQDAEGSCWTVESLNGILDKFPNVVSLSLHLNSNSPGFDGDYSKLKDLPIIKELELHSEKYDRELRSYRQIISCTPNLTALHLGNEPSKALSLPRRKTSLTVNLPSLTRLSLRCCQLCRLFHKIKLLSDSTLSQIKELELHGLTRDILSRMTSRSKTETTSLEFLETIGKNLTTLIFGGKDETIHDTKIMKECPNISTFVSSRRFSLIHFPPSLATVKYLAKDEDENCLFLIGESFWNIFGCDVSQVKEDWTNVKRFEIENGDATNKVKQAIFEKGVELVVDGSIWTPSLEPEE